MTLAGSCGVALSLTHKGECPTIRPPEKDFLAFLFLLQVQEALQKTIDAGPLNSE
jgi:hypothetical protein